MPDDTERSNEAPIVTMNALRGGAWGAPVEEITTAPNIA